MRSTAYIYKSVLAACGAGVLMASMPATADDATAALAAFRACTNISDDTSRLACFDKAAGAGGLAAAERALADARAAQVEAAAAKAEAERKRREAEAEAATLAAKAAEKKAADAMSFGADRDRADADEITATVTRIVATPVGRVLFYLDNGTIWEQTDTKAVRENRILNTSVIVKRAALGGFVLTISDLGIVHRVKRRR
ncbi:hypothetical protein [Gimibacter soli]|uniref:Uncharacterized protein n=1 Tax=Gimibacter soli TaxID=3024400 RepID=A0AAE9XQ05_9PROT|nr:hypothetical protein [Gimibacter soli]WCL54139.1 hypothetical protein PH603_00010 [Gimibacter soli]